MSFSYSKLAKLNFQSTIKPNFFTSKSNQNQTNSSFYNYFNSINQYLPQVFKLLGLFSFLFGVLIFSQMEIKAFAENETISFQNWQNSNQVQSENQSESQNSQQESQEEKYKLETQEMLDLINKERVKNGAGVLKTQKNLVRASSYFANYLATKDLDGSFFDHQEKSGRGPWQRCRDFEYPITCGENLAAGQLQVKTAFEDLMKSSSHRKNILNPKYCQIGISKSENPNSYYGIYWVQNFGRNCE